LDPLELPVVLPLLVPLPVSRFAHGPRLEDGESEWKRDWNVNVEVGW
jgi:hypothetical protein